MMYDNEDKRYSVIIGAELTLHQLATMIIESEVDAVELVKYIDMLISDCEFTSQLREWVNSAWDDDCAPIMGGDEE